MCKEALGFISYRYMVSKTNLSRFLEAQKEAFEIALKEVRKGKKTTHWMWYIFPQIRGLGQSETSKYYAIKDKTEAQEYLNHEILGRRLIEITTELLKLQTSNAVNVFGSIDSLKLKSSMTLFSLLENTNPVFQKVLDKFFSGEKDETTVHLLNQNKSE